MKLNVDVYLNLSSSASFPIYKKINNWNSENVCLVVCSCLVVVCGRLLVVSSRLIVVCGRLLVVCGHLLCWWFVFVCASWCSFVVVDCFSSYATERCWKFTLIRIGSAFSSTFTWDSKYELKLVWNLKPLWNVVPFIWQFTWRFHCSNFPNNRKTLLHMCKWYLLINANLTNAKQMLRYWLFFKQ